MDYQDFCGRLRTVIEQKNMDMNEVSLLMDKGHGYISEVTRGLHGMSVEDMLRFCEETGISPADLFTEDCDTPGLIGELMLEARHLNSRQMKLIIENVKMILGE